MAQNYLAKIVTITLIYKEIKPIQGIKKQANEIQGQKNTPQSEMSIQQIVIDNDKKQNYNNYKFLSNL